MRAKFISQRSAVTCIHGCAASSQPLATNIGLDILKKGGNAADAAVAMAAALNVLEPCSTGIGGDAFCLFFDSKDGKVKAMNASGRSPAKLTLELLNSKGINEQTGFPTVNGLSVTVPGAAAGWVDCVNIFGNGKLSLKEIIKPAIDLAKDGFPVAGPWTTDMWQKCCEPLQLPRNSHGKDLLIKHEATDGTITYQPPQTGEIFKNPNLARVLETLAEKGKPGFYDGWVADAIVAAVKKFNGVLEKDDLLKNNPTFEDPISMTYKDVTLWETAPNSQGIIALITLNIMKNFDIKALNQSEYMHLLIESLKLGLADGLAYCSDPEKSCVPIDGLLSENYGKERAKLIQFDRVIKNPISGSPQKIGSDTVYFTVVDKDRNACSFINSNYEGFGTGIVPEGCGFSLQNRGSNFNLNPDHPNVAAPNKRPYHTIIPAIVTESATGKLLMSYGIMGGFMQAQAHVQVLLNCVEFNMNPQEALDHPRLLIQIKDNIIHYEEGFSSEIIETLKIKGHNMQGPVRGLERLTFGKGQAIATKQFWKQTNTDDAVLWAGSDPRCDGMAAGY